MESLPVQVSLSSGKPASSQSSSSWSSDTGSGSKTSHSSRGGDSAVFSDHDSTENADELIAALDGSFDGSGDGSVDDLSRAMAVRQPSHMLPSSGKSAPPQSSDTG